MQGGCARGFRGAVVAAAVFLALAGCKKEPTPAELHLDKGDALLEKSDFFKAAEEYAASLQANPQQEVKVWEKTAYAYMKAGEQDKAADYLLKTLPMRADDASRLTTYRNIAGMYLQAGQLDKAEQYFGEVLKRAPSDDQSLTWLAEISSHRGGARRTTGAIDPEHLNRAIERYDQIITLKPAAPAAYINKRIALMKLIDHQAAMKQAALDDAETNKADKQVAADAKEQAAKYQARIDELKATLDDTNKKLGEVQKAAKQ